jgi:hypothetical protein
MHEIGQKLVCHASVAYSCHDVNSPGPMPFGTLSSFSSCCCLARAQAPPRFRLLQFHRLGGKAEAAVRKRWWHRLLRPFRPEAVLPSPRRVAAWASELLHAGDLPLSRAFMVRASASHLTRCCSQRKRQSRPFRHQWLGWRPRVAWSRSASTGYDPFIDAGQVGLGMSLAIWSAIGRAPGELVDHASVKYKYARHPGSGSGRAPIPITLAKRIA